MAEHKIMKRNLLVSLLSPRVLIRKDDSTTTLGVSFSSRAGLEALEQVQGVPGLQVVRVPP
jgi:hypothetical protein